MNNRKAGRPATDPATHQKRRQINLDDQRRANLKLLSDSGNLSEGIRNAHDHLEKLGIFEGIKREAE